MDRENKRHRKTSESECLTTSRKKKVAKAHAVGRSNRCKSAGILRNNITGTRLAKRRSFDKAVVRKVGFTPGAGNEDEGKRNQNDGGRLVVGHYARVCETKMRVERR